MVVFQGLKTLPWLLTACRIKSKSFHMIEKPFFMVCPLLNTPSLVINMSPSLYPQQKILWYGEHMGFWGVLKLLEPSRDDGDNRDMKTITWRKPVFHKKSIQYPWLARDLILKVYSFTHPFIQKKKKTTDWATIMLLGTVVLGTSYPDVNKTN